MKFFEWLLKQQGILLGELTMDAGLIAAMTPFGNQILNVILWIFIIGALFWAPAEFARNIILGGIVGVIIMVFLINGPPIVAADGKTGILAAAAPPTMPTPLIMNWVNLAKYIYYGLLLLSLFMGLQDGANIWRRWIAKRVYRHLVFEHLEPVVNVVIDTGNLVWLMATTAGLNVLISATFPVSVPILIYYFQK